MLYEAMCREDEIKTKIKWNNEEKKVKQYTIYFGFRKKPKTNLILGSFLWNIQKFNSFFIFGKYIKIICSPKYVLQTFI